MTYQKRLFTIFALALVVLGSVKSSAATLMSFSQISPSTQFVRWNDTGSGTSVLTTISSGNLGAAIDVNFTFLAANAYYSTGTTVAAKLHISGTVSSYGYANFAGTKSQYIDNVSFSFTDTSGTINYLSGTSSLVSLDQLSSNTALIDMGYYLTDLTMTSDAFNIDTLNDDTQAFKLNLSPLTPATFADSGSNGVLDTENMNITTGSNATAVPGPVTPVPEPGSALLVLAGCTLGLRRRR